ncbi:hypothetical protein B1810_00335 [Panacagrimonas perspica]|nr:hypothetical protein B1810_00335 [Panacagrimonas perspica]
MSKGNRKLRCQSRSPFTSARTHDHDDICIVGRRTHQELGAQRPDIFTERVEGIVRTDQMRRWACDGLWMFGFRTLSGEHLVQIGLRDQTQSHRSLDKSQAELFLDSTHTMKITFAQAASTGQSLRKPLRPHEIRLASDA